MYHTVTLRFSAHVGKSLAVVKITHLPRSWESSVSIVLGYSLRPGNSNVWFLPGTRFLKLSIAALEPTQPPSEWLPRLLSTLGKVPGGITVTIHLHWCLVYKWVQLYHHSPYMQGRAPLHLAGSKFWRGKGMKGSYKNAWPISLACSITVRGQCHQVKEFTEMYSGKLSAWINCNLWYDFYPSLTGKQAMDRTDEGT